MRQDTVPPPVVQPKLVVTIPPKIEVDDRTCPSIELPVVKPPPVAPKSTPVVSIPPVAAVPAATQRPGTTPPTIIPIPKLPSVKDRAAQIQPVVAAPATRPSRTRLAKGTGPVAANTQVGVAPPPPVRPAEPDMSLPARTVAIPSIKRVAR